MVVDATNKAVHREFGFASNFGVECLEILNLSFGCHYWFIKIQEAGLYRFSFRHAWLLTTPTYTHATTYTGKAPSHESARRARPPRGAPPRYVVIVCLWPAGDA